MCVCSGTIPEVDELAADADEAALFDKIAYPMTFDDVRLDCMLSLYQCA